MIDDYFWHSCFGHQEIVNFFFHLDVQGTKNKDTLRETDMEPENTPLEKEKHLPNTYFWVQTLSLPEGKVCGAVTLRELFLKN